MNRESKLNIQDYLNMVDENFSGANGYYQDSNQTPYASNMGGASYYGNMSGTPYSSGADGMVASAARRQTPSPYRITIVNSTGGILTAKMFGYNKFATTANFGSEPGLVLSTSFANVTYQNLLFQSATQSFDTSLVRIQSENTSQVTNLLEVTALDADGRTCTDPISPQDYFSEAQFQGTIISIPFNFTIDGTTYISTQILPNTTVKYTFFQAQKVNPTLALRQFDGNPLIQYAAPAVPILGAQRPQSYPAQLTNGGN